MFFWFILIVCKHETIEPNWVMCPCRLVLVMCRHEVTKPNVFFWSVLVMFLLLNLLLVCIVYV
jgi:hypothetical protein